MKTPYLRWPRRVFAALAGWVAALAFPVSAEPVALKGWLSFGPEVPGESIHPAHVGWLDFEGADAAGDPPQPGSTITLRRRIDKATPLLMKACAMGTQFPKVDLHLAKVVEGQPKLFWALTLTDVMVSSFKNSGDGGSTGAPGMEDLELVHTGVRMTYIQIDDPQALPVITNLPYTGDADDDGMPDAFEEQFGLLVHSDDRDMDSDNDGLTNLEEFQVGTDPSKGSSFFKAIAEPVPGGLNLTWNSVPGASYNILHSPNLADAFEVVETIEATGPTTTHLLPRADTKGFYKVEKAP